LVDDGVEGKPKNLMLIVGSKEEEHLTRVEQERG
jgi:hypothetical protein